jgi:hypothetical protein
LTCDDIDLGLVLDTVGWYWIRYSPLDDIQPGIDFGLVQPADIHFGRIQRGIDLGLVLDRIQPGIGYISISA